MTTKQLIEILARFPDDIRVVMDSQSGNYMDVGTFKVAELAVGVYEGYLNCCGLGPHQLAEHEPGHGRVETCVILDGPVEPY